MTSNSPLVSVCIPTRNRAAYLREALQSVLAEDVPDLEILVFDDASTDGTASVVRDIGDPRIVCRRHSCALGIAGNRNALLDAARGEFLAWLDDDDAYVSGGLRRQIETLEAEPDVALVHGVVHVVDAAGRSQPPCPDPFDNDTVESGAATFEELVLSNFVRAPTVVTRATAHRAAGPFAAHLGDRAEDWDAWLRLALHGDVAFSAHPIARYRRHEGSTSISRSFSLEWLESETLVVRRALQLGRGRVEDIAGTRRRALGALASRHLEAATDALARGQATTAARATGRALRLMPSVACRLSTAADHASRGDEHGFHEALRPVLRRIADSLDGTRYGSMVRARVDATDAWADDRARVARRIREVVPAGARVAAIDKWDPSLLHDAERTGWHFPDLELAPDGYPADDDGAIGQLEAQRARGAEYLVVPRNSFWWLEHYKGFCEHLRRRHHRVWADDACVIYQLLSASGRVA